MTTKEIRDALENAVAYLTANPQEARYTDSAAVAIIDGLAAKVTGPDGEILMTDMPTGVGGGNTAPSPGWVMRAAIASCVATLAAMRAAQSEVVLEELRVTVDSESDDRGILGIDDEMPAGPLSVRINVAIAAPGVARHDLEGIAQWAVAHCPVSDAVTRATTAAVEIDVLG